MDGSRFSRSLSCKIFWSSVGTGEVGVMRPICMGKSAGAVLPTRGVVGLDDIGVVGDIGRSLDMLLERNMPSRLVPARPNDASSSGGVSAPLPCSDIELNDVSRVAPEGDRGRLPPNKPRNAETATDGGRLC